MEIAQDFDLNVIYKKCTIKLQVLIERRFGLREGRVREWYGLTRHGKTGLYLG